MPDSDESCRPSSGGAFVPSEHRDSRFTPDPASCNCPADIESSHQPAPTGDDMSAPDPSSPLWPPDLPGGVAMQESILRTAGAAHARVRDDLSIPSEEAPSRATGNTIDANNAIREQAPALRPPAHRPASPPADLYMSDSEMTDTLSEMGGVPLGPYLSGQIALDSWVEHFVNTAIARHQMATISEDSDDDEDAGLIMDYETPMEGTPEILPPTQEDDLDDTHKFYSDDLVGDASDDDDDVTANYHISEDSESLSEVDFDDFYRGFGPVYDAQFAEVGVVPGHDDHNYFPEGEDPNAPDVTDPHFPPSAVHGTTHEKNFTIDQFIQQWMGQSSAAAIPGLPPLAASLTNSPISSILAWKPPAKITRPSRYPRDFYDIQQIPWWQALRVHRSDARDLRDLWYTSYHNVEYSEQRPGKRPPQEEHYFREKAMYTKCKATFEHFQLRNLMSVAAYNTVHFAHKSKLYSWIPAYDDLTCLIDLSKPRPETGFQGPVRISTMKSAHDVAIAGGFNGEYALRAVGTDGAGVEGFVTKEFSGITNHVDIVPSRSSRSPLGIFASNDRHLRVLDCETNTFIADHELSRAINCTSTSQDGRLRVVIGDSPDAWVIEADTGRPVHPLRGHRDFGFACAWSPDMRHIATSNQDKTVIIWDARTWRILERIESDVAGYRSLRFSPVGGGPRTLLLCEPADRIAVVNAQTYQTRQVHDFFGEIGGADYSADGSTIWVANTDEHVGGFMEYERRQWGQRYGPRELAHEWVRESELDEDARCVLSDRERQMRFWWNLSDEEHERLLV